MTKREIANLCCRVLAVFYLVQAITGLGALLELVAPLLEGASYWSTWDIVSRVAYSVYPLILGGAALFLWKWSWLIAAWMTQYDVQDRLNEPDPVRHHLSAHEWHAIAFSTIGLWVLIDVIPRFFGYASQLLFASLTDAEFRERTTLYHLSAWIDILLRSALGAWLLFGASGLVTFIHRIRNPSYGREQGTNPP